ncbi:bifunctional nuclease family protein [Polaribacter sp.]|nr:bifunctional nuclease family protein [Polaribacter sp.]
MSLIQLDIKGISYSQTQTGAYALVLKEMDGKRTLPIIIGAFEAQSIAIALEKEISPPRPLTHDLFKTFSKKFEISVTEVIIHKLVDGVFFSSLVCVREGIEEIIDTRTSDAIAIAVRFNAPIYTHENILDKAGVFLKVEEELALSEDIANEEEEEEEIIQQTPIPDNSFASLTIRDLNSQLGQAVADENYELAAKIRDEISKRS